MNRMQAEYRTEIARLAEDMAKRDATVCWWLTAIIVAAISVALSPSRPDLLTGGNGKA